MNVATKLTFDFSATKNYRVFFFLDKMSYCCFLTFFKKSIINFFTNL